MIRRQTAGDGVAGFSVLKWVAAICLPVAIVVSWSRFSMPVRGFPGQWVPFRLQVIVGIEAFFFEVVVIGREMLESFDTIEP